MTYRRVASISLGLLWLTVYAAVAITARRVRRGRRKIARGLGWA